MNLMNKTIKILLSILCFFVFIKAEGQNTESDSIKVVKIVNEFYNWYITTPKDESENVMMPTFSTTSNNLKCLDYSNYVANLRKYHFSEELIKKEIQSYKTCDENLRKITTEEYAKFEDIDDFENIDCDFTNSFRWIGGQEMIDGIKITNIDFVNNRTIDVIIEYFSKNRNEFSYWGNRTRITLIKKSNAWKINNIDI